MSFIMLFFAVSVVAFLFFFLLKSKEKKHLTGRIEHPNYTTPKVILFTGTSQKKQGEKCEKLYLKEDDGHS